MKKYNQIIEVKVSVNSIATKLIEAINPEQKHKENIVDAIIGSMVSGSNRRGNSQLGFLYNALNGFSNELNFKVGEIVTCSKSVWKYEMKDDKVSSDTTLLPIGKCVILSIDEYSEDSLEIEYETLDKLGKITKKTNKVSHLSCDKVFIEDATEIA